MLGDKPVEAIRTKQPPSDAMVCSVADQVPLDTLSATEDSFEVRLRPPGV